MSFKIIRTDNIPEKFLQIGERVSFKKDHLIIQEGDTIDYMYILIQGKIIVFSINESGSMYYDFLLVSPCIFGESYAINQKEMDMSFKCLEDCELIKISRKKLLDIMKTDFDINIFLYNLNTSRVLASSYHVFIYCNLSCEQRVIQVLLKFAELYEEEIDGRIKINYKFTQQFISDLADVKRITTIRTLNKLRDEKIIEFVNGYYYINDIESMKLYIKK